MKEFNLETVHVETASALETVRQAQAERQYPAYIGLDVHKDTIVVAVARAGRAAPELRDEIANKPKAVAKLVERLNREFDGEVLLLCYEAGPCGYGLYRQLLALGHDCQVVAPSLIPKKPGERIRIIGVGLAFRSERGKEIPVQPRLIRYWLFPVAFVFMSLVPRRSGQATSSRW